MGLLVTIRESWAAFLSGDGPSGAGAYFNPEPPKLPISVFTEKLKSIEQKITDAQTKRGLSVVIVTVSARGALNQIPHKLQFSKIIAVARVFEAPTTNIIGVPCSDVAEAIAWFTRKFVPPGCGVFKLEDIALAPNSGRPDSLAYDVIYSVESTLDTAPVRG